MGSPPADTSLLSTRKIPREERLIVALDVPSPEAALALVDRLGPSSSFYKLGLELAMADGYFDLVRAVAERGKKVFADVKLYDIPNTVGAAVRQLSRRPLTFVTVHGGNDPILAAACDNRGDLQLLAVTVLTSFDRADLAALGITGDADQLVLARARRALEIGCAGVIASGLDAPRLRRDLGHDLLIVTPGIRPAANRAADDQKRVVDPRQAFLNGADYIVVGRPIRGAAEPRAAAEAIQATLAELFPDG